MGFATIAACGGFAAICGSSVATAATFSAVAYPEMRRFGYPQSFATGVIAAGGTLGAMLPPSIVLAVYGIITEQDIGKLFIAGILPGILAISMYLMHHCHDRLRAAGISAARARAPWSERFAGLKEIWAPLACCSFSSSAGFTACRSCRALPRPKPAASAPAGAFVIGVVTGRLDTEKILASLLQATRTAAAVFTVLIGALHVRLFSDDHADAAETHRIPHRPRLGSYGVLALIMLMYWCSAA